MDDPLALEVYADLRRTVGAADAACVAHAQATSCLIASDDKMVRREIETRCGPSRTITTPGLLVLAIRRGHITIEEADEAKEILAKHRFVMSFESFRERVKP